ncbi:MAG TPA: sulfate ABC transporter ATP-binding protein [Stellaceae bacterium]|jgi:sulfate transport system ATP-binding protein|nr:sulfate ABC transporter ATP-binding protein [Stellaceae bacterium]
MRVELAGITKHFGSTRALDCVDLTVGNGELVALLGPSGSGKTSLLRIIGGLEQPTGGRVLFDGEDATGLTPAERGIGFVFQHYALFRHMSVFDNVAFGLRVRKRSDRPAGAAIKQRVGELLDLVQLSGLGGRLPSQISGGQRQRVALARALAVAPKLLLLDEPFGALDAAVRHDLRAWLGELHAQLGLTTLFVTHDQAEAFELGHRVAILRDGRIEQIGAPDEIYEAPRNPFVMEFVGRANRLSCTIRNGRIRATAGWELAGGPDPMLPDGAATAYVRPDDVVIHHAAARLGAAAQIRHRAALGNRVRLVIERDGEVIEAEISRYEVPDGLLAGSSARVSFRRFHIFTDQHLPARSARRAVRLEVV